jgi:DNA-binding NtrC family response regulator
MHVLIIGDLEGYVVTAAHVAKQRGAHITHVQKPEDAMIHLRAGRGGDVVLMDMTLDIKNFVSTLEGERFFISVVACGIHPKPKDAEQAILDGAKEYLPLPPNTDLIAAILEAVSEEHHDALFEDPKMLKWVNLAKRIAKSEASILITGESGTGKEVISRYIHQNSTRAHRPFISINCAAIPENLLESELFGYEKGAFTGATDRRIGKFEEAHGGTLLLDEISEMDPRLQAKLLRAIQEKHIDRVGGKHPIKVDIRILATSNRNMIQAVKSGQFREDLYFRLNVMTIDLPPLRERPKDIEKLAHFFVEKYTKLNNLPYKKLSFHAIKVLLNHPWPGNVRELENTIHRAVLLSSNEGIEADDLFLNTFLEQDMSTKSSLNNDNDDDQNFVGQTVFDMEQKLIVSTLTHCLGNRTHAAKILGISIRTLRNKLNDYMKQGMRVPSPDIAPKRVAGTKRYS